MPMVDYDLDRCRLLAFGTVLTLCPQENCCHLMRYFGACGNVRIPCATLQNSQNCTSFELDLEVFI